MFLSDFINKIYELNGDMDSEIEIINTEGDTLTLEDCFFEKDCTNTIIINTGIY